MVFSGGTQPSSEDPELTLPYPSDLLRGLSIIKPQGRPEERELMGEVQAGQPLGVERDGEGVRGGGEGKMCSKNIQIRSNLLKENLET